MVQMNEDKLNSLLEDALDDLMVQNEAEVEDVSQEAPKSHSTGGELTSKSDTTVTNVSESISNLPGPSTGSGKARKKSKKKLSNTNSPVIDEEEMNKFFENMAKELESIKINPDEAKSKIDETVPQIFDLMQNLLSKELLYPALKDLSPKFEEWLDKNRHSLSEKEMTRFKEQKNIIDEIIEVFDDDSLDNQNRFERNLDLMEKMQSLGSPPEELTVPGGPEKCSIM